MFGKYFKKKEPKLYENSIFLFSIMDTLEPVMRIFCDAFGVDVSGGHGNTLSLNHSDSDGQDMEIHLTVISETLDDDAKEFVKDQRDRVRSHFVQVETMHTGVKTNLFYQLGLAKSVVHIQYSFFSNDILQKRALIEDLFIRLLPQLSGVLLIMDQTDAIFCAGEDGCRKLVLSETGDSDFDIYLPKMGPGLSEVFSDIPAEPLERRNRSRELLKKYGIHIPPLYPVIESEAEAAVRTPEEIAKRAFALMEVALYSECMVGDGLSPGEAWDFIRERTKDFGSDDPDAGFFSPEEWNYLHDPDSTELQRINGTWQYENLHVMEWALGLTDTLDFPDHYCDVPQTVRLLKNYPSVEEILDAAKPRTAAEILDACDLIFCLDWACVDARLHQLFPAPAGMDGGVVQERHKSLNWLAGYQDSAPWDEVSTDT